MKENNFEFDFERLKVYQKALELIDKIFEIYKSLPVDFKYPVGSNLIRAGLSIANNIAEGSDKKSHKERARYYGISSDSARECISVFIVLNRQNLLKDNIFNRLRIDGREITSMIHGLVSSLKN